MDKQFKQWFATLDPFLKTQEDLFYKAYLLGKSAKKKDRQEKDECFQLFVKVWTEQYPELGFTAVDGSKIKSLIERTRKLIVFRASQNNVEPDLSPEKVSGAFEYVLKYLKRSGSWYNGKSLSKIESSYLEIIREITNGKPKPAKKESARDFVENLRALRSGYSHHG